MFYRIRFAKYGVVKFIGHLDVMRYFQKAIRRSELLIKYSQGYSPHQLLVLLFLMAQLFPLFRLLFLLIP